MIVKQNLLDLSHEVIWQILLELDAASLSKILEVDKGLREHVSPQVGNVNQWKVKEIMSVPLP